jgi:hypothetical protein
MGLEDVWHLGDVEGELDVGGGGLPGEAAASSRRTP